MGSLVGLRFSRFCARGAHLSPVNQRHPGKPPLGGTPDHRPRRASNSPPDRSPQTCLLRHRQPSHHLSANTGCPPCLVRSLPAGRRSLLNRFLSLFSQIYRLLHRPLGYRLPSSGRTRQGVKCTSSVARVPWDYLQHPGLRRSPIQSETSTAAAP